MEDNNTSSTSKINYFKETNTPFFLENSDLRMRHQLALPPKEAYYFFPKGE